MGRGRHVKARTQKKIDFNQKNMADNLDTLSEFERFRDEILPAIRRDMLSGMSAADLYKKYQAMAAGRALSIAISPTSDNSNALSAVKDILDRSQGKAKERSEVTHKMSEVPEEQLDAMILSKLGLTKEQSRSDSGSEDPYNPDDSSGSVQ